MRRSLTTLLLVAAASCSDAARGGEANRTRDSSAPTPDAATGAPRRDAAHSAVRDAGADGDADDPANNPTGAAPTPRPPFDRILPPRSWLAHGAYSSLSSPRAADLNRDGTLDVITGHGLEVSAHDGTAPIDPRDIRTLGSVTAHDGATGALLWQLEAEQDLVGSATFIDITGDGTPDVVIGGRYAELIAVDGRSGSLLWRFFSAGVPAARSESVNGFYSTTAVADYDGDDIPDLVAANGGDATLGPKQIRPTGHLFALSGATGTLLGKIPMPDGAETYMSTTLLPGPEPSIVFGSGGESWGGALFRIPVSAVFASDASRARTLATRPGHGFIAPASLADLTADGTLDIVASAFDGFLIAIDGATDRVLFERATAGVESHASPIFARITEDEAPDIWLSVNEGAWPNYSAARHLLWDGATGELLVDDRIGLLVPSGHVAADLDGDGRDEIIWGVNYETGELMRGELAFQLHVFDPRALASEPLGPRFRRPALAAPWLGDLDADGTLELLVATGHLWTRSATWWLERYDLHAAVPARPFFGAYMGSAYDGRYDVSR